MQPMMAVLVPRAAVLLAVALAACAEASPSALPSIAGPVSATPEASLSAEATPTASEAPTEAPMDEPIAEVPPPLALEEVASGLHAPINITVTPDGWLLVNERIGRVVAVDPDSGETSVVLDIDDRVLGDGEQGLLGLALHPDWPEDARAFVHYSAQQGDGDTVLSEFRVTDEPLPPVFDATTERVLLTLDQPYRNHNGGQLAFGPDGYLYMGLGDGGSSGDPHGNGQNPDTLLGKILRIDVDTDNGRYAVPPDNPFVEGGGAPEVLLTGLRNPWRFSFDRETGLLWIGDVGQGAVEEIDRVDPVADAGANLGWNVMEGSQCFAVADCSSDGFILPVTAYGHDAGCSVTGGYVYRGASIPDLRGWYLFSDYCSGTLFGVRSDADGVIRPRTLLDTGVSVSTFGEGPDGELYLAALGGGGIYRIVADD
jgi:glucose/arabinose dehydrogenase